MKESITKLMETLPDTKAESIEQMTVSGDTSRPGTTTWEPNRQNGPDDVEPALKRSPITVTMLLPCEAICVGWKLTTVGTGSYVKDTPEDIDTLSPTVTSRLTAHVSIGTSGLIGLMHSSDDDVRKRAGAACVPLKRQLADSSLSNPWPSTVSKEPPCSGPLHGSTRQTNNPSTLTSIALDRTLSRSAGSTSCKLVLPSDTSGAAHLISDAEIRYARVGSAQPKRQASPTFST